MAWSAAAVIELGFIFERLLPPMRTHVRGMRGDRAFISREKEVVEKDSVSATMIKEAASRDMTGIDRDVVRMLGANARGKRQGHLGERRTVPGTRNFAPSAMGANGEP